MSYSDAEKTFQNLDDELENSNYHTFVGLGENLYAAFREGDLFSSTELELIAKIVYDEIYSLI